jgi:hypothetical protein
MFPLDQKVLHGGLNIVFEHKNCNFLSEIFLNVLSRKTWIRIQIRNIATYINDFQTLGLGLSRAVSNACERLELGRTQRLTAHSEAE